MEKLKWDIGEWIMFARLMLMFAALAVAGCSCQPDPLMVAINSREVQHVGGQDSVTTTVR